MPEAAPKTELMRSLGRLVRGLSGLFWGLPIALLTSAKGDIFNWFRPYGFLVPIFANGLLFYSILQLSHFQKQERVWRFSLEQTKLLALINLGLSPFLFFWHRVPKEPFFANMVGMIIIAGILFLFSLNLSLRRLAWMLPDETLREETRLFTALNRNLLLVMLLLIAVYFLLGALEVRPMVLRLIMEWLEATQHFLIIFLVLLPVALTMTLIWKIKEVVFQSVFNAPE